MATLEHWYLTKSEQKYRLHGYVKGHPRLEDDCPIISSSVQSIDRQGDYFFAITKSGTLYEMGLSKICAVEFLIKDTITNLKHFGFDNTVVKCIKKLVLKQEKELFKTADQLLENQELLLVMFHERIINAYFKFDNNVEKCDVSFHVGTFQDSVLVGLSKKEIDFRYFPNFICEIYCWSDNLKYVKVKNESPEDIIFASSIADKELCIKPGEVKSLDKKFKTFDNRIFDFLKE